MRHDHRGSWYLLTGAVLGVAVGLLYAWVVSPVKYIDAPPYALRADFKDDYRALVAASYLYSGDLFRAEDRLAQLKDDNPAKSLVNQAQQESVEGRPPSEIRPLEILAMALGEEVIPTPTYAGSLPAANASPTGDATLLAATIDTTEVLSATQELSPEQPTSTPLPPATSIFQPTRTPMVTPTPGAAFQLDETRLVCNPDQADPLIQVIFRDAAGQQVPGIELLITWDDGSDHFFTGLKPELGAGYADFEMTPGTVYGLSLVSDGQVASNLIAAECVSDDGTHYWGSWLLNFIQP